MEKRRCTSCRKLFHPRAQSPDQKLCPTDACQLNLSAVGKKLWTTTKCASDADYRDNDALALLDELYASLADHAIEVGSQIIGG